MTAPPLTLATTVAITWTWDGAKLISPGRPPYGTIAEPPPPPPPPDPTDPTPPPTTPAGFGLTPFGTAFGR